MRFLVTVPSSSIIMCNSHTPACHLVHKVLWCQLESILAGSTRGLGIVCESVRSTIIQRSSAPSPAVGLISRSAEEPGPLNTHLVWPRRRCVAEPVCSALILETERLLSLWRSEWRGLKITLNGVWVRAAATVGRISPWNWDPSLGASDTKSCYFFVDLGLNSTWRQAFLDWWGSKTTLCLDISVQDQYNHPVSRNVRGLTEVRGAEEVYISYSTLFLICSTRESSVKKTQRGQNKSAARTKSNQTLLSSELQPG